MKKLFFLLIAFLAIVSCERAFTEEKTNLNAKTTKQSKDSIQLKADSELEVDPGTIVPPRR